MSFEVRVVLDLKTQPPWCSFVSWLVPWLQTLTKNKTNSKIRKPRKLKKLSKNMKIGERKGGIWWIREGEMNLKKKKKKRDDICGEKRKIE